MEGKSKSLVERVYNYIDYRAERLERNEINCIPTPLHKFADQFPGIEQGTYYLISGAAKASKSKITNFLFLFNAVIYAYEHPELLKLKVFYALLEEKDISITIKFICYLLYIKERIRVDIKEMISISNEKCVDKALREHIKGKEYRDILEFFEKVVTTIPDRNPTGIYNPVKHYALTHGTEYKKEEEGFDHEIFDYYVPDDPNEYVMIIVDHVGKISTETIKGKALDKRESINKLSEYMMIVRNKYNYIPVMVQQQNSETISLEAVKAGKISPTQKGLYETQDTARDCDVFIGISNPYGFHLSSFQNYDISMLKESCRFIEVVLSRDGQSNDLLGLYFDGATGFYKALPNHKDAIGLSKVYGLIRRNEESKNKREPLELNNPK